MAVAVGDGVACEFVGDVLVVLWREPATLPRWEWLNVHIAAAQKAVAKDVVLLYLILPSSSPPDAALRAKLQQGLKDMGDQLRRLVVVPVGNSIWMSVVRSIARTLMLVVGLSARLQICGSFADGVRFVRTISTSATPSETEMSQTIDALHKALGVSRAAS